MRPVTGTQVDGMSYLTYSRFSGLQHKHAHKHMHALFPQSRLCCFEQKHNYVQSILSATHQHLLVQSFLHAHFNTSWQILAVSGRVVQNDGHVELPVTLLQPHESGDGTSDSSTNCVWFNSPGDTWLGAWYNRQKRVAIWGLHQTT